MVKGVWEVGFEENASSKALGSCHRSLRRLHSKEREDLPFIKNGKEESTGICG